MANSKDLSDKERALIERARRELAKRGEPATPRGGTDASRSSARAADAAAPVARPPIAQRVPQNAASIAPPAASTSDHGIGKSVNHGARIAAIMAAEREETERQRRRIRRWGLYAPLAVFAFGLLWLVILLLRRPWS